MMVLRTTQSGGSSLTAVSWATHDKQGGRERARKESDQNVQRNAQCMNARGMWWTYKLSCEAVFWPTLSRSSRSSIHQLPVWHTDKKHLESYTLQTKFVFVLQLAHMHTRPQQGMEVCSVINVKNRYCNALASNGIRFVRFCDITVAEGRSFIFGSFTALSDAAPLHGVECLDPTFAVIACEVAPHSVCTLTGPNVPILKCFSVRLSGPPKMIIIVYDTTDNKHYSRGYSTISRNVSLYV